jgi:hypothetical protein
MAPAEDACLGRLKGTGQTQNRVLALLAARVDRKGYGDRG